jgi:hypothetical protein
VAASFVVLFNCAPARLAWGPWLSDRAKAVVDYATKEMAALDAPGEATIIVQESVIACRWLWFQPTDGERSEPSSTAQSK